MITLDYYEIGKKIKSSRIELGLSQEQAAELCNISASFYGHIERGTRRMSLETMVEICRVLNISTDYLLSDELPNVDSVLVNTLAEVKKAGTVQYERYTQIIKALSKIANDL